MVMVCGVISVDSGKVWFQVTEKTLLKKGLNSEDICKVFQRLRNNCGPEKKICVFLDNASIHRAVKTRDMATALGIKLIFNMPYCPQYMGIELFWQSVKHSYKKRVGSYRVNDEIYSNVELVKELLTTAGEQVAIDAASRGWKKVNHGMPL